MALSFQFDESAYNYSAAKEILPWIIDLLNSSSVLDVGCGTGTWLKVAQDLGIKDILGVDGAVEIKSLLKVSESKFIEKDLREPLELNREFDLVMCLEVGEHLPADSAATLVHTLCRHGETILFSAAIPGQGGQNHINEQWPAYWAKLFKENDFNCYDILRPVFWNNEKIDFWYRQNLMLYSSKEIYLPGVQTNFTSNALVHPELLKGKVREIEMLKDRVNFLEIRKPGVRESVRNLTKALKDKFFR